MASELLFQMQTPDTFPKLFSLFFLQRSKLNQIPIVKHSHVESSNFLVLTVVSMVFIVMVLGVSGALYCLRHHSHLKLKEKLASLGTDTSADATAAYQVRAPTLPPPINITGLQT